MPIKANCPICKKELKVKPSKFKKQQNVFCSRECRYKYQKGKPTWNKGMKGNYTLSEEHKKNISKSILNNPKVKKTQFKKGYHPTKESIQRRIYTIQKTGCLSKERNGMYGKTGKLNPNWKGGVSYWRKQYYNSIQYKEWQKSVFKRDNYKCQICGDNKENGKIIHAHHIKTFAKFPKLRLILSNGVTLCNICHSYVHSKKFQLGKIIKIEKINESTDMIDIEVKDNNNFFANGILVHNSATPFREDGRTDFIFALTGFPVGLDWSKLLEMNIVKKPAVYLYIVDSRQDKVRKLNELLKVPKKTLIFCDSIEFGEKLSKQFEIPFVYGSTSNRLQILENAETSIVSRVGDEGVSLPALERVIEIDFLFGSRRQEGQRMGRLFHAEQKGEHIILMTEEEFESYEKRLYAIYEKGFKIEIIR